MLTVKRLQANSMLVRLDEQKLADLASQFDTHQLAADRVIFEEIPGDKFYWIARSSLEFSKLIDGESRQLASLSDSDFIGEITP